MQKEREEVRPDGYSCFNDLVAVSLSASVSFPGNRCLLSLQVRSSHPSTACASHWQCSALCCQCGTGSASAACGG